MVIGISSSAFVFLSATDYEGAALHSEEEGRLNLIFWAVL